MANEIALKFNGKELSTGDFTIGGVEIKENKPVNKEQVESLENLCKETELKLEPQNRKIIENWKKKSS